MNDELKPFLNEGLKVYAAAKDTIAHFEEEISSIVSAAVRAREEWFPLKKQPRIESAEADKNVQTYWISTYISGLSERDGEIKIECGVWWKVPETNDQPIVFANYEKAPERIRGFDLNKKGLNILSFTRDNVTFLYLPVTESAEIVKSLNRVLDVLLKQLAEPNLQ